ncbi:MAG: hypothetical protein V4538_00350 [Bacteroidota bacterium]
MINDKYKSHSLFEQLVKYSDFYKDISFAVMPFKTSGTHGIINIDTYTYSSISGTIESIKDILLKGRINDSYALLRKYYDSTIINVYSNLYLQDNFSMDDFIVEKIDNWLKGKEKFPAFAIMSNYIRSSNKLKSINALLYYDDRYKNLRARCNDHTHYNYFHNLLSNDNNVYSNKRLEHLDRFAKDIENIFILHFAYIATLNDHYLMSEDYMDAVEMGMEPEEGVQYLVAPFVQEMFSSTIKTNRPDLATEIKRNTEMHLE